MSRGRASHDVSPLLVAVLVAVSACVSTDALDDDTFMSASSPLVSWSGRMAVAVDGSVAFDWENTAASFVVNGQGASVTLLANITVATARVSVYVNGYDAANIMMRKGKLNAHFALDGASRHCTGWHTPSLLPSTCRTLTSLQHEPSSYHNRRTLSGASRLSEALRMSLSFVRSFIHLCADWCTVDQCVTRTHLRCHHHAAHTQPPRKSSDARTHTHTRTRYHIRHTIISPRVDAARRGEQRYRPLRV